MRSVWSFLFWISDEGLGGGQSIFASQDASWDRLTGTSLSVSTFGTSVCPSSPLFAATTTAAVPGGAGSPLQTASDVVPHIVKSLYNINLTYIDPLPSTLLRFLFGAVGLSDTSSPFNASNNAEGAASSTAYTTPPTLLSDVSFLHMTKSRMFNLTLIAVLEGQIITVLVIICFILIILVRDYVVQQQPEINMRAAFAAADNGAPQPPVVALPADLRAEDIDRLRGPDESDQDEVDTDTAIMQIDGLPDDNEAGATARDQTLGTGQAPRLIAEHDEQRSGTEPTTNGALLRPIPGRTASARSSQSSRPNLDLPEQQSSSTPSLRLTEPSKLESQSDNRTRVPAAEGSTVHEYLRIYREAGGDPEKILQIAKNEQLEDKLAYWIRLTQSMVERSRPSDGEAIGEASTSARSQKLGSGYAPSSSGAPEISRSGTSRNSDRSSEWEWPDDLQSSDSGSAEKGKGKAGTEEAGLRTHGELHTHQPPRPRSYTDNPPISDATDLLGNNNWSFSHLPGEDDIEGDSARLPMGHSTSDPPVEEAEESRSWEYPSPPSSTLAESRPSSIRDQTSQPPSRNESGPIGEGGSVPNAVGTPEPESGIQEAPPATEWENLPDFNELEAVRRPTLEGALPPHQPGGLARLLADFMWQDVDAIDPGELPPLPDDGNDFADHDDPFAPLGEDPVPQDIERDREVVEAAAAAGLDAEAIEDAEDLEGIMELIGMRGPVAGLFQNAIFCAFLVSISIFVGVFLPYNIGRSAVWLVANPMRPVRILFSISKFVQDVALIAVGSFSCACLWIIDLGLFVLRWNPVSDTIKSAAFTSWNMSSNAALRIVDSFTLDLPPISAGEIRNFSAVSHEALLVVKDHVSYIFAAVGRTLMFLFGGDYSIKAIEVFSIAGELISAAAHALKDLPAHLSNPGSWVIDLNRPEAILTINSELAYWSAMDRTWAILGGYLTVFFVAGLYLRRGSPFSRGQAGQEWEASVIDGLNQASGVMKVILIIGIEMLIFPLYCGLLLDIALLPLFENTSIISRILFTVNYPLTSIFVHWFVGTGYMFHFALFVSMCRKIMRKGVLYFIRDPDDPEFHPVRDVLERNVTTQLRKILFSAFVYGALVIICLGGVVWGLAYSIPNVLPIHYSSNEPVLEFPIDLLFYNFLMPLAVKFFKPSDGLHAMYTWWFRKCARALRISWFLFGERRIDEEGTLVLAPGSPHRSLAWWKRQLLELTEDNNVIPKTWRDTFEGGKAKPTSTIPSDDMIHLNVKKVHLVQSQQLIPDGRFVRSPASDQVKIPKGKQVFLDVSENNLRLDGKADLVETDLYSTNQYQFVYIPPNFRLRVFLFIMFIWIFAAVTGVGFTIIPLAFGRQMFHLLIPSHIRTNDIYAFSIGIYLLGSLAYSIVHIHSLIKNARNWTRDTLSTMLQRDAVRRVARVVRHGAKLVYAYLFLLIIFPLMVSSLMELYFLIPLDTYMYSAILSTTVTQETAALGIHGPKHTIRVIQSWTIGVLYLKLGARIVASWYRDTRMTAAIRAVLRRGWLEPDVSILTRAFVVPGVLLWVLAVAGPLISARIFVQYGALGSVPDDAALTLIYRLSFPIAAMGAVGAYILWSLIDVFRSWRVRIRDEAYLIGERLHNFGVGTVNTRARARDAWRAGGTRL